MARTHGPNDRIVLLRPETSGGSGPALPVGRHPSLIGRDRGCDLVLMDPHVSRQHALVWFQHNQLMVRDLGSALGTRVGDRKVLPGEVQVVERDAPLQLAGRVTLCWSGVPIEGDFRWAPELALKRVGRRWTTADPGHSPFPRSVPGRPISSDDTPVVMTLEWVGSELELGRYTLTVAVERGAPAEARFEDAAGAALMIGGEARVVLLFLLARQRLLYDSGQADSPWLDDRDLGVGLWGHRATELPASRLNTLVTRVRNQLDAAGFPRDLLDKRTGATRLGPAVGRVALQGWSNPTVEAVE